MRVFNSLVIPAMQKLHIYQSSYKEVKTMMMIIIIINRIKIKDNRIRNKIRIKRRGGEREKKYSVQIFQKFRVEIHRRAKAKKKKNSPATKKAR